jgi:transposase
MENKLTRIQAKGLDKALWQKLYNKHQQSYKRKRLEAIRLAQEAKTTIGLQKAVGCGHTTLNKWMDTYLQEGLLGLVASITHQKPQRLTADQRSKLAVMILDQQPCDVGLDASIWTAALIKDLIKQEFAVDYQTSGVYKLLYRMGLSHQKAHRDYANASKEEQMAFIDTFKKTAHPTS